MSYYIIYPRGDRAVLDIVQTSSWDADDYALASREDFEDEGDAIDYAKELAKKHDKKYVGPNRAGDKHDYLD